MSDLIQPKDALIVPTSVHMSDYGRECMARGGRREESGITAAAAFVMGLQNASLSDATEVAILEHMNGKATSELITPVYLALCTVVPTDASTGTSITEANYTGYARKKVEAADWAAAVSGSPTSQANANVLTYAACTAGTSTVIAWALCTLLTLGRITFWGTATSTVISTTQTPATVAAGLLSTTLD
jgi:hypothetical protein